MDLDNRFFAAVDRVRTGEPIPGITNEIKLTYYALYKQATHGDCNTPKPSLLSWAARAKWSAWKKLEGASRHDAMRWYINRLDRDVPNWR